MLASIANLSAVTHCASSITKSRRANPNQAQSEGRALRGPPRPNRASLDAVGAHRRATKAPASRSGPSAVCPTTTAQPPLHQAGRSPLIVTGGEHVRQTSTREIIVAVAAQELVVAAAAEHGVVASLAVEVIVAVVADQHVGGVAAEHPIIVGTAIDVVAVIASEYRVVAGAADDGVVSVLSIDVVVSWIANDRVGTFATEHEIVAFTHGPELQGEAGRAARPRPGGARSTR